MGFLKRMTVVLTALILCVSEFMQPVFADDPGYGVSAYQYLQEIDANYGYRISDPRVTMDLTGKDAAGAWISQKLQSFGYSVNRYDYFHGVELRSYSALKIGASPRKVVIGAHYDCVSTKGVEDNGTGVAMVLELAERFKNLDTPLTLEFCFWDGEETQGYAGTVSYLEQTDTSLIECYINVDCIGAGDWMYAYGGAYEDEVLVRDWVYNMAKEIGYQNGISFHEIPVTEHCEKPPTRTRNSDQYYFNQNGFPYVYFDTNRYVNENGEIVNQDYPYLYNSALPAFSDANGQIAHIKEYEDLTTLEAKAPGRIQSHLSSFSLVISEMLLKLDENSAAVYADPIVHEEPESESTPESASESVSESASSETQESSVKEPEESTVQETSEVTEEASADSVSETSAFSDTDSGFSDRVKDLLWILSIPIILLVAAGLIFWRARVMIRRNNRRKNLKKKNQRK